MQFWLIERPCHTLTYQLGSVQWLTCQAYTQVKTSLLGWSSLAAGQGTGMSGFIQQ